MFAKRFSFLVSLLFVPLASAQSGFSDVGSFVQQVVQSVKDIFIPIFSALFGVASSDEFLLTKILLFVLLFILVRASLKFVPRLGEQGGVVTMVAFVISFFAARFISENELTKGILLPYGTLGIVLTTALPFLVLFFALHAAKMGGIGRRLAWAFFGIVFVALFISRFKELSQIGKYIYLSGLLLIALCIFFDKAIHQYFFAHELSMFYKSARARTIAGLQAEYLHILSVDTPEATRRRTDIEAHLHRLGADVP